MTDTPDPRAARRRDPAGRDERVARALRANLQRRKEQRRAREARPAASERTEPNGHEPLA